MFNFLKFFKNIKSKKGQSMVEYAIIIGVVVVVGFSAASGLYDAARHNFYYGLLPTNSQNISLPDGPNGEKGWFNEDYMGIPKINCSASLIPQPTPIEDDDGRTVLVYGVDPEQEIYCQDVSVNSVRNNWGSQYKSIMLGTEEEKKLSITIWDHFGMTHSTYVLLRPYVNSETGAEEDKPVARITTQPSTEDRIFLETDDIAVFGTTSSALPGGQIDAYEWEIVDIGYVSNKKQTEAYKVHPHGNSYTNLIKSDPDYKSFNIQIVSDDVRGLISRKEFNQSSYTNLYLGANPKGTRYLRLRVHSTGSVNGVACTPTTCWSDWTQEPIKTGESERPRAVITAYKAENFEYNPDWNDTVMKVRENDNIFLTYTDSINPLTADMKVDIKLENGYTVETNKGLISYKWHISKLNIETDKFEDATTNVLQEIDSINTLNTQYTEHVFDEALGIYGFRFKEGEIGTYCIRLSVRNEDGIWSYLGECDSYFSTPEAPHHKSIKYIEVKEKNIPPEFGTDTTSTPTMQSNKTIKANTNQQVQIRLDVIHPEIRDNPTNYMHKFQESDYTFGEYYWELLDALGNVMYKSSNYPASNSEILTLPKINRPDTYTLKVRVKDKTGMWNENPDDPNAIFTLIIEQVMNEPIHFPYTGDVQTVTLPAGTYKLQLWGAKGGDGYVAVGGNGGYSYGTLTLTETKTLYVYIGGKGEDNTASSALSGGDGGWNGGGDGGTGGGGASDIRMNGQALSNRILVAGGGGGSGLKIATDDGSATNKNSSGGAGGGTSGINGVSSQWADFGSGGSQSSGGTGGDGYDDEANGNAGSLGQGGQGGDTNTHGGGGGGGYYGGGGGGADIDESDSSEGSAGGGGGSGYVSNILTEGNTIAGNMSFETPDGGTETGHANNGYGIITPISNVTIGDTWEFTYSNSVQQIELEKGTYRFEVWGAQGGNAMGYTGGKGGYSSGTFVVTQKTTYYIVVGGQGGTTKNNTSKYADGGYNGGGRGYPSGGNTSHTQTSGGGGGATHIAKSSGLLSSFNSNRSAVIIVAGGGGGGGAWYGGGANESSNGGAGGGSNGETATNGGGKSTNGGTQTTGYSFGQGGTGGHADSGGGGGGWYGGYANTTKSDAYITGGGGGSGYIGGVTNGTTTSGQREGNGYAKITVTGY